LSVVESARPLADAASGDRLAYLGPRSAFFGVTALLSLAIVAVFAHAVESWTPFAWAALPLVFINALWIAGGAATALVGLAQPDRKPLAPPTAWLPSGRTAVLVTLCGEDPRPLADYLMQLAADLERRGLKPSTRLVVLSDTSGAAKISAEEQALRSLIDSGRITYRRRTENNGPQTRQHRRLARHAWQRF
jgi:membrane glycosyltransferase